MASRRGRAIDGVLLFDKPEGMSSNHALQRVRRLLDARKAGHTGTLDPFATGLMVLCFGAATRYAAAMLEADKQYVATLRFGTETNTGDHTGQVVMEKPWQQVQPALDEKRVRGVLRQFVGRITQVPPMYSALKRDGRPLYEYAREGIEIKRQAREVEVHEIELLDFDALQGTATIRVDCGKGTYIRTLAQDIGRAMGSAAHLTALRRTRTAGFSIDHAVTLSQLEADPAPVARLQAVDVLLQHLPVQELESSEARRFLHGQTVRAPGPGADGMVRVYGAPTGRFLGTANRSGPWLKPDRLIALTEEYTL